MPIFAKVTTPTPSRPRFVYPVDNRRLEFRSPDGSEVVKWNAAGDRSTLILDTATGLDVPPRDVLTDQVPGMDGARLRLIRTRERQVFLPLLVRALDGDWAWVLDKMAEIRSLQNYRLRDYVSEEGTFDLVATRDGYPERTLRATYLEGMEGDYGSGVYMPDWRIFGIKLLAVDPYWHGREWSTPTVSLPSPMPFLSNDPADAFPRQISASVALGEDMSLTIPGDVPSPAVIELTGPADQTVITSAAGLDVTIGALADGDHFVLDTGRVKTATLNGVSDWSKVGTSPQWRPFRPGETSISMVVTGATSETRARVYGRALWETPW